MCRDLPVGISLVLKRNVLNSGQNYKVRLLVKSKSNLSAIVVEATADLNTPSRPIAGKIEVIFGFKIGEVLLLRL